jgi:hypothetical protein
VLKALQNDNVSELCNNLESVKAMTIESVMYVPSYLLAAVRAAELDMYARNKYGDK